MDWLYHTGFVRWLASLFTQQRMESLVSWLKAQVTGNPTGFSRSLLITAIVLAVVVFTVDQLLYWSRPDQIDRARRFIARVRIGWRRTYRRISHAIARRQARKADKT